MNRSNAGLMAAVLFLASGGSPAIAQQQHEHEHESGAAAVASIKLDAGRKWATDAQYDALADRIESQVDSIVANCRLPPEADANLHYVIADLSQGVSLMRGQYPVRSRHDGAALVHGALLAYGRYFDDPEWSSAPPTRH